MLSIRNSHLYFNRFQVSEETFLCLAYQGIVSAAITVSISVFIAGIFKTLGNSFLH